MIRLPPSTIVLGRSDIKDFEKRRKKRQTEATTSKSNRRDKEKEGTQQFSTPKGDGRQNLYLLPHENLTERATSRNSSLGVSKEKTCPSLVIDISSPPQTRTETNARSTEDDEEDQSQYLEHTSPGVEENSEKLTMPRRNSSPSKYEFQYGGFVESLREETPDLSPGPSPTPPSEISTPQDLLSTEPRRLRIHPLPRSPLFISQNINSPEQRPTIGLTPRVASRVARLNTPSILFSQPPRRPARGPAQVFRHQTNSFSFDSSERASVAYEQERIASYSTTESAVRPSTNLNLHDELHGLILHSSGSESLSSPEISAPSSPKTPHHRATQISAASGNDPSVSSPDFALPPPFSSSSRNSSGTHVRPSRVEGLPPHPRTSPVGAQSLTPIRRGSKKVHEIGDDASPEHTISPSPNHTTMTSLLQRLSHSFASYRRRTSTSHRSPSSSPTSSQKNSKNPRNIHARTPSTAYRVYDDSLPASSQPQTPAHLPEARHQSRFHHSLTMPALRASSTGSESAVRLGASHVWRQASFATPSRRMPQRNASPTGLQRRGFEGLYGGRENGNEEQDWEDGIRFSNAGVRLWGIRDARNDGRSMRETPEPEDRRVGRRD